MAILIDVDGYLTQLSRYIYLNPVHSLRLGLRPIGAYPPAGERDLLIVHCCLGNISQKDSPCN